MTDTRATDQDYIQICLVEDDPIMGESIVSRFQLEGLSVAPIRLQRVSSSLAESTPWRDSPGIPMKLG